MHKYIYSDYQNMIQNPDNITLPERRDEYEKINVYWMLLVDDTEVSYKRKSFKHKQFPALISGEIKSTIVNKLCHSVCNSKVLHTDFQK